MTQVRSYLSLGAKGLSQFPPCSCETQVRLVIAMMALVFFVEASAFPQDRPTGHAECVRCGVD
jgi:hypothetical protein